MSTAYYILKNEEAPEWSDITMEQLQAIAATGAFEIQKANEGGLVLYDGNYLHVGVAKDGTVVSFERFGGNDPSDMLDAIEGALAPDQFIADEHSDIVNTLMEAELDEEDEPVEEPSTDITDDDKEALKQLGIQAAEGDEPPSENGASNYQRVSTPLTPESTAEEVSTYIYENTTLDIFQSTPRQDLNTGDDDQDFIDENDQYADKIYDETMGEMIDYAPATEPMFVEEFIDTFWPQLADDIRGMIYEHIYAGIT